MFDKQTFGRAGVTALGAAMLLAIPGVANAAPIASADAHAGDRSQVRAELYSPRPNSWRAPERVVLRGIGTSPGVLAT